jgi:hypothetical protein
MSKDFKIKDKSGRDGIVHVPKEFLLQQENEEDWKFQLLHEFAEESDVGDTWDNGTLEIECILNEEVEKLEEPKIHIKEAIKENTVIHCETKEEANRILGMAESLGYKWWYGKGYEDNTEWNCYKRTTCYYLFDGSYSNYNYFQIRNYNIIPSTQIEDSEEAQS